MPLKLGGSFVGFLRLTIGLIPWSVVGPLSVKAAVLNHVMRDNDSMTRFQLQGACQTIAEVQDPHWCQPARASEIKTSSLSLAASLRADEKGYQTVRSIMLEPLKKDALITLFSEKEFSALGVLARLEANYSRVSLSYTPLHLVGAYHVSNPSLPEVAFAGLRQSVWRLTSGHEFGQFQVPRLGAYRLKVGVSVYRFDREYRSMDTELVRFIVDDADRIIHKTSQVGLDADLGLTLMSQDSGPHLGILVERLHHAEARGSTSYKIDLTPWMRRRSALSIGQDFPMPLGILGLEGQFLWDGLFSAWDRYRSPLALQYSLGRLKAFLSASSLMSSFGFAFLGPYYQIGIQYTDEKQPNQIKLDREKMTYVFTSIRI